MTRAAQALRESSSQSGGTGWSHVGTDSQATAPAATLHAMPRENDDRLL